MLELHYFDLMWIFKDSFHNLFVANKSFIQIEVMEFEHYPRYMDAST